MGLRARNPSAPQHPCLSFEGATPLGAPHGVSTPLRVRAKSVAKSIFTEHGDGAQIQGGTTDIVHSSQCTCLPHPQPNVGPLCLTGLETTLILKQTLTLKPLTRSPKSQGPDGRLRWLRGALPVRRCSLASRDVGFAVRGSRLGEAWA